MMKTVYIYVLDTLADWEIGHITAELNSRRFFKTEAPLLTIKTVGHSRQSINTMGGIEISPDCLLEEIELSERSVLLLPGADTWNEPQHLAIVDIARQLLATGGTVGAICGATVALANNGLLDNRLHTSNGLEFLEMFAPNYKGAAHYREQQSVNDNKLITSSATGVLMWTKQLLEALAVFEQVTLEAWYNYFSTGKASYFFELIQTLSSNKDF